MLVKDVMTKSLIKIEQGSRIRDACEIMTDNHIGCLVVTKNNKMRGILTERDIIEAIARNTYDNVADKNVSDVMTNYVITIKPTDKLEKAIDIMIKNKIKKLPVMNGEIPTGIITVTDIAAIEPRIMQTIKELLSMRLENI
jgi:CBS domain-containing protein